MITSCLNAYVLRHGDFCTNDNNDNDDDTTDYFTPCTCARGKNVGISSSYIDLVQREMNCFLADVTGAPTTKPEQFRIFTMHTKVDL